ncbi:hypothetical protein [Pseudomonas sp. 460]|uniref:hypothetical protein n=1 Tax=Pseudomonas sp. 460 TaxID=2485142 RepID=UPI0010442E85|nr:hypothetical protein [Pseudomonas sp. 460]TCV51378.1 hypothetical protein EDB99_10744 [Pseudomonas sp. 460]
MKMLIESEVKRAEALVERYMGLPPDSIDLFSFNADALRKAPAGLGRAIRALRQVAGKPNPSKADVANAEKLVELIAELAQGPKLPTPIQKLWAVEEGIRNAGGLWTLKHLVTIALAFAGVLVGSTKTLTLGYEMFAYVALALIVASGALHLTHSKNAGTKVPVYTIGGLVAFCVFNTLFAPNIGFLVLLVCAIGFMAGSFLSLFTDGKSSSSGAEFDTEAYQPVEGLRTEEPNPYWVTAGNDMSEPIDNLK